MSPRVDAPTVDLVTAFLVERYLSRRDLDVFARSSELARLSADELSRRGTAVQHLRSIFVPADETCFYLYEALWPDNVREAAERAALPFERLSEAVLGPDLNARVMAATVRASCR